MKRRKYIIMIMLLVVTVFVQNIVLADDISLLLNNTNFTTTSFSISNTGEAGVVTDFEGYPNVTTGATITIKIEKRNLLLFWSDVVEDTVTVVGDSYYKEHYYQLENKGTYRCTVVYTIAGTGGADDVLTFEDTAKYE